MSQIPKVGLVMTGGGARGAYQAGVIRRIAELPAFKEGRSPFPIVTGASAGALNAAAVAVGTEDFSGLARKLYEVWATVEAHDVFRVDALTMARIARVWAKDLTLGGIVGGGSAESLLDASPLRDFLLKHIDFSRISVAIAHGALHAIAVPAVSYNSGKTYFFVQGQPEVKLWSKSRRLSMFVKLDVDHIRASAAIPIVFQPVRLQTEYGVYHFGDGCLRLTTPLSPAIRLGAQRVFAVGVRSKRAGEESMAKVDLEHSDGEAFETTPPIATVLGTIFNAIFLDHLEADVEHLERMNELLRSAKLTETRIANRMNEPMRIVDALAITPSLDLGKMAEPSAARMPRLIRYALRGLAEKPQHAADLMSYLLFHPEYTRALLDLGYRDANDRIDEIEDFLRRPAIAASA